MSDKLENKLSLDVAKKIDFVESSGNSMTDAWDKLTIYDRPVLVKWNASGVCIGLLYKYSGGKYGMGVSQVYYSTTLEIMSVIDGVKTTKAIVSQ